MEKSLQTLMDGLIDYAGLFPPATLEMPAAVRNYAAYREGPQAAWLGRFVAPAARLEELMGAAESLGAPAGKGPGQAGKNGSGATSGPWRLSVLIGTDPSADFRLVQAFNGSGPSARPQPLVVDAVEVKAERARDVAAVMAGLPAGVTPYFEIPIQEDPSALLAAIGRAGGRAKVRTGGVTENLFPAPEILARFLAASARATVPFKATAGMHHPVRSLRPLTYAPDSPKARMHGFLNVFMAAAFATLGMDERTLAALLAEESPAAFVFRADGAAWRGHTIPEARLAKSRRDFAVAFGSCSFEEPREDLSQAGLL